jgi:adenylate cyclase
MVERPLERRLAAILACDVAGYSRLMSNDEEGTLTALKACRRELLDPKFAEYRGRIFKLTGDGALVEFASAVDATRCAMEIQRLMAERRSSAPSDRRVEFRIGINVGEIIVDEGDIYGDGVNIATRVESLANPGGICLSENAYNQINGEADPQRLADGVSEDIITELSRFSTLSVVARNSSTQYKDKAQDLRLVGRELGARYLLEGSIRSADGQLRLTAQLIDAETGTHLWAERYDRKLKRAFKLRDEVVRTIAAKLAALIQKLESERAAQLDPPRD